MHLKIIDDNYFAQLIFGFLNLAAHASEPPRSLSNLWCIALSTKNWVSVASITSRFPQMVHGLLLLPNLVNQRSRLLRIFVGTGFKKLSLPYDPNRIAQRLLSMLRVLKIPILLTIFSTGHSHNASKRLWPRRGQYDDCLICQWS